MGANGKLRAPTLRDARKYGGVPGFSAIARMEYQPGLERWKIEQAYMAALTLPRIEGETLEEFMARAKEDAGAQALKARDRGTELHGAIESYYKCGFCDEEHEPFVQPVVTWLEKRFPGVIWHAERAFAHPFGYGGRPDLSSWCAVVDFKFKDFSELPKKSPAYPEHGMQLAAYDMGMGGERRVLVNLFISSTVPGLVYPHEWSAEDQVKQWKAFTLLLQLWQLRNDYDSSFEPDDIIEWPRPVASAEVTAEEFDVIA
jgi:hypothetical protein